MMRITRNFFPPFRLGAGIDVGSTRFDVAFDDADAPGLRRASVGLTYRPAPR
jgi:hypothetical protein